MFVVSTGVGGKGRKGGQWGWGTGTKNGTVDSEHGVRKGRGSQHPTRNHHSKYVGGLFLILNTVFSNTTHAIIFNVYVSCFVAKENTFSPLQVKNKPHDVFFSMAP